MTLYDDMLNDAFEKIQKVDDKATREALFAIHQMIEWKD
jgi:hypothetical protein